MSDTHLHLGLDAGELSLKVVLYDAKEKSVVRVGVLDVPVPPLNDIPTFETALQVWLTENSIEDWSSVSLTVSSFRSIVRQIFVPAEVEDIAEYLNWYLSTIINDSPKQYYMDYQIIGGSKESGWTVLFIALREEWVNGVRKGFRNKKLSPQIMNVDATALLNLIEVGDDQPTKLRCILKADIAGVSLMWLSKNHLRVLRGVSTLELVGREQEDAYKILSEGIVKQIELAKTENSVNTETIFVCGDISTDALFMDILKAKLPETQVELLSSFPKIKVSADEAEEALLPLCVGALGAAVQAAEVKA